MTTTPYLHSSAAPPHLSETPDVFLIHSYPHAAPSGLSSETGWADRLRDDQYMTSFKTFTPGQVYLGQQTITSNQASRRNDALRKEIEATMSAGFNHPSPYVDSRDAPTGPWRSGLASDTYHVAASTNSHVARLQTPETIESVILRTIGNISVAVLFSQPESKTRMLSRHLAELARRNYVPLGTGMMLLGNPETETEPPLVTHDASSSGSDTLLRPQLHPVVNEFQVGVAGEPTPTTTMVSDASALVQQIENVAKSVELSVDVDGALSFVVVLQDDTLITGEFTPIGELYAWRYDKTDWSARTGKIDAEPNVLAIRGWLE